MLTEQESEILGIMFGDGSLSRSERSVQIVITGNKVDDENYFLGHVRPLFLDVFDLELTSRYRQNENTMDLYRHSKKVALTLHSWGMPFGLKKLEDQRPQLKVVPRAFIRGFLTLTALFTVSMVLTRRFSSRQFPIASCFS